jgi:ABC-type branched-subunit amino acid transport system permease subunit
LADNELAAKQVFVLELEIRLQAPLLKWVMVLGLALVLVQAHRPAGLLQQWELASLK